MNADSRAAVTPAKPPVWHNPAYRAIFFQLILLVAVVVFGLTLFDNTLDNLRRQGIASGFGFLSSTAGFDIVMHLIPYSEKSTYGRAFLVSLINTLVLSALGIVLATVLGLVIGIARLSKNWIVAKLAAAYIETIRNIPLLLQLFFWYFAVLRSLPSPRLSMRVGNAIFLNNRGLYLPAPVFKPGFWLIPAALALALVLTVGLVLWSRRRQARTGLPFPTLWVSLALIIGLPLAAALPTGLPLGWDYPHLQGFNFRGGMVVIPEFTSMLLALSIYTAAFIAEIVRAGIQAVSHGQTEAAYALGLRPGPTLRLIILPQALRVIIPPLTSEFLNLTKNSSLATAIAYPDLVSVFAGTVLNQTGQAVEIIAITMAVYLMISLLISLFMNLYNRKMALVER